MLECIIIGGGPAGLNAALVLGRARRQTVLFDNNDARNKVTHESHGFITRDGVTPKEFREAAHNDIRKYPSVKIKKETIIEVYKEENGLINVKTADGQIITSKKLIFATGLKERLPNIEGVRAFYGKSLFSCPYCDGWEQRDQPLVLISENAHAVHMAKMIYQWSKDLIICTNGNKTISDEDKLVFERKGILVREEKIARLHGTDGKLEKIIFEDGHEISRTGGFVTTELYQGNQFGASLGCALNENDGIIVDTLGKTNINGVFAAGDTSFSGPSQLIIAASEGVRAAAGVNSELTMEEF
ncbi:NAD(P)/FAD-dependent oxidoreductase [Cytobacillus gottheilii]|uniref:NAD(P)/FAD-dependent oxidoreductase n=1 Tax=Cytobacillus gottheilii TaxID=859144 RepID=A0ABX8FC54_9BACI|nr:NAD(P)/FAD-dependent oxidoreductase [Cytobacillus gottheilii]QVY61804.1 NAD(P)/FAD-dependent oxidoreductase [Cytobacillus gottheilii]